MVVRGDAAGQLDGALPVRAGLAGQRLVEVLQLAFETGAILVRAVDLEQLDHRVDATRLAAQQATQHLLGLLAAAVGEEHIGTLQRIFALNLLAADALGRELVEDVLPGRLTRLEARLLSGGLGRRHRLGGRRGSGSGRCLEQHVILCFLGNFLALVP